MIEIELWSRYPHYQSSQHSLAHIAHDKLEKWLNRVDMIQPCFSSASTNTLKELVQLN